MVQYRKCWKIQDLWIVTRTSVREISWNVKIYSMTTERKYFLCSDLLLFPTFSLGQAVEISLGSKSFPTLSKTKYNYYTYTLSFHSLHDWVKPLIDLFIFLFYFYNIYWMWDKLSTLLMYFCFWLNNKLFCISSLCFSCRLRIYLDSVAV